MKKQYELRRGQGSWGVYDLHNREWAVRPLYHLPNYYAYLKAKAEEERLNKENPGEDKSLVPSA